MYFLQELGSDSETANKCAKEVYEEVIRRAHTITDYQQAEVEKTLDKLNTFNLISFFPRLKEQFKKKFAKASANDFVYNQVGLRKNKDSALSYSIEK